jgi:protein TonB
MGFAVFIALALHLLLILGLTFEAQPSRNYAKQLKVTLATRPSATAPEDTRHIAQANQAGSGEEPEPVTNPAPLPDQQTREARDRQLPEADSSPHEVAVLSTKALARDQAKRNPAEQESHSALLTGINPEVERLAQQVASLEATLENQSKAYSIRPRVRRLTSVSAKQAVDAAYLHDWRARLEAVGNRYYPEASLRYGIYGELRLLVIIRQDGSLEDIQVLSSSGYAVLDEAAMKIVRLAAPFAPFPAELRATTDKLEIIRTWQFQENRLSSG